MKFEIKNILLWYLEDDSEKWKVAVYGDVVSYKITRIESLGVATSPKVEETKIEPSKEIAAPYNPEWHGKLYTVEWFCELFWYSTGRFSQLKKEWLIEGIVEKKSKLGKKQYFVSQEWVDKFKVVFKKRFKKHYKTNWMNTKETKPCKECLRMIPIHQWPYCEECFDQKYEDDI